MELSERGAKRDRAILRTLFTGAGLQFAIAAATLVSLPFVTRYLSAPEFGVFATLVGFMALLSFGDLGIGGSLTTRLATKDGLDDIEGACRAVSTALVAACATGVCLGAFLASSLVVVPWRELLGADELSNAQIDHAVLVTAAAVALSAPAAVGQRMLYGVGHGGLANLWLLAASLMGTGLLLFGCSAHWPLYGLVAIALTVPAVAGLASAVTAVRRFEPRLQPRLSMVSVAEWRKLRSSSGWYLVIGVAGAFGFQTDALVVSSIRGAADAGVYLVAARVFGLIAQALTPAMLQLWPAFAEAFARRDRSWIRSRLVTTTAVAGLSSLLLGAVLVAWGQDLIGFVLTPDLAPGRGVLVALACWTTYSLVSAPSFLLLNATGRVRVHGIAAVAVALVNLPASIVLTHLVGMSGPAWGSVIASLLCSAVPGILTVRSVISGMESPGPEMRHARARA